MGRTQAARTLQAFLPGTLAAGSCTDAKEFGEGSITEETAEALGISLGPCTGNGTCLEPGFSRAAPEGVTARSIALTS